MPVIPEFGPDSVPQPAALPSVDPAALAQGSEAVARGATQAGGVLEDWNSRYVDAKRQADTENAVAGASDQMQKLSFTQSKIPDAEAAMDGFNTGATGIIKNTLAGITDPLIANAVNARLGETRVILSNQTHGRAFEQESSLRTGQANQRQSIYAGQLASATDPVQRQSIMDQIVTDATSTGAAGWMPKAQIPVVVSGAVRSAVAQVALNDPLAAQKLMTENARYLTTGDAAELAQRLRWEVPRAQASAAAQQTIQGAPHPDGAAGTAAGLSNNVGNLKASPAAWAGKGAPLGGFETFATPEAGVRAAVQNIQAQAAKIQGPLTLTGLINTWAPASDNNDPAGYAANVSKATGIAVDAPLDTHDPVQMAAVVKAMTQQEKGQVRFPDAVFQAGAQSAIDGTPLPAASAAAPDGYNMPDLGAQLADVRHRTADKSLDVQLQAEGEVRENWNNQNSAYATGRGALDPDLANLSVAYSQGLTSTPPPEGRIRQLYPRDEADRILSGLRLTRQAGDAFRSVQFASPQDEQNTRSTLAAPGTLAAGATRGGGPTAPAAGDTTDLALRGKVLGLYDGMLLEKHKRLAEDPAAYAAQSPEVKAAIAAIDPAKPETFATTAAASLAMQRSLGVAEQDTRILTAPQVAQTVRELDTTDPAKGDMGQQLDNTAKQYGAYWPKVFGEMVRYGKLDPSWQLAASMDAPAQTGPRQDYVRALQATDAKGGLAKLREDAPPDAVKAIDAGVDGAIADFVQTAAVPGAAGNIALISMVRDGVKKFAYYKAMQGMDGGTTLQTAVDGLLNDKYDFSGTMRVPKGMLPLARASTAAAQQALQPGDLDPGPPSMLTPGLTAAQRQGIILEAARRGEWMPNETDTGLVLIARLRNGAAIPVQRAGGGRVEISFADMLKPQPPPEPAPLLGVSP